MARKSWYEIQNATGADEATVYVYDEIGGWGVDASQFCKDLAGIDAKTITLKMNSPGGSVFDGCTIYNALKSHAATVNVQVDGLAASIASIIAMAGDKITMAKNAMMMIHNAWGGCVGNANDMEKMAGVLAKIDKTLVDTYADRTGTGKREIAAMMDAETWMTADEARAKGFCDSVGCDDGKKASFDLSKFKNVPQEALALYAMPKETTERDIEQLLRDAGVSNSRAKAAVAAIKGDHREDDELREGIEALVHKLQIETLTQRLTA